MRAQGRRQDQCKVLKVGQKDENKCTKLVLKFDFSQRGKTSSEEQRRHSLRLYRNSS